MTYEQLQALPNVSGKELGEATDFDPAMILVAAEADASTERIIDYLANRAQLPIEVVTFTYAKLDDGREIVARFVLSPEAVVPPTNNRKPRMNVSDEFEVARKRGVMAFAQILHQVNTKLGWPPQPLRRNGGTIRYWVRTPEGGKVSFGMNVGGKKIGSPDGVLDVWLRPDTIALMCGKPVDEVWEKLRQFPVAKEYAKSIFIRIRDDQTAAQLFSVLEEWDSLVPAANENEEIPQDEPDDDDGAGA